MGQPLASDLCLRCEVCEPAVGPRWQGARGNNRDVQVRFRVTGTAGAAAKYEDACNRGLPEGGKGQVYEIAEQALLPGR